jgi:hypothetical protein
VDLIDRIAAIRLAVPDLAGRERLDRPDRETRGLSARFRKWNASRWAGPHGSYGAALREGILRARGRFVVCEEIDLADFHRRALEDPERGGRLVIGPAPKARATSDRWYAISRAWSSTVCCG